MLKDHQLIIWLSLTVYLVNEMVIGNGWLLETYILFQKSIRCSHHKEKYLRSLQEGIPPVGLRLMKKTTFAAI